MQSSASFIPSFFVCAILIALQIFAVNNGGYDGGYSSAVETMAVLHVLPDLESRGAHLLKLSILLELCVSAHLHRAKKESADKNSIGKVCYWHCWSAV